MCSGLLFLFFFFFILFHSVNFCRSFYCVWKNYKSKKKHTHFSEAVESEYFRVSTPQLLVAGCRLRSYCLPIFLFILMFSGGSHIVFTFVFPFPFVYELFFFCVVLFCFHQFLSFALFYAMYKLNGLFFDDGAFVCFVIPFHIVLGPLK